MKRYKNHSISQTNYLRHTLNTSPAKISVPFSKSQRFPELKSYLILQHIKYRFTPNKFYQIPNLNRVKSTTMGLGNKYNFVNNNTIDPGQYNIRQKPFQKKNKGFSFGIGRDQYYKMRQTFRKAGPTPVSYNIDSVNQKKRKTFYMGQKIKTNLDNGIPGPTKYQLAFDCLSKLSGHSNKRNIRIKTDYYQKSPYYRYDNKTPGPGSYDISLEKVKINLNNLKSTKSKHLTSFGLSQRMKSSRSNSNIGPGTYTNFSIFGDS